MDLRVDPGERVLLLGASGAGKSTLLAALAGLLDAEGSGEAAGRLLIHGRVPARGRDQVGLVFQDPESQLVMGRAGDEVAFGLENRCVPTPDIWPRVDAALQAVGWPYGRDRATDALSGGEQQRLALAGVLAAEPSLVLLDEPTANLDPEGADLVRAALQRVLETRDTTLVVVEHRVTDWLPLISRVVVLEAGAGILTDGTPAEVFGRQARRLAARGIWTPEDHARRPRARPRPTPQLQVVAEQVGWVAPGADAPLFSRLDLQLRTAEALAVTGRNGSGKSTLVRLLGGLLRPQTGTIRASEALAPGGADPLWRWPARRLVTRIGSVFQDPEHQFLTGRVTDELALGPRRAGLRGIEVDRRVTELAERLHLAHLARAHPFTLSGGEKRRLSVATALATDPAVLLLDEPTFGQDRQTWTELLGLLTALRDEGRAVCVASHDRAFVDALADRSLRLPLAAHRGRPA